jgi:hypothetical protein
MNNADDHMRLIKATLKNTFPGGVGPLTNVDGGFTAQSDGSAPKPAYAFASEPTLGFYRSAAGVISVTGGRLAGGASTGSVQMFIAPPASLGAVTADTGKEFLELNGATYNRTDYPVLADFLNGVGIGSTFTLPDMYTLGRFPRSRTAATAVRTAQANTVGPHTHPDVNPTTAAETQEHTHTFSGTTSSMNRNASHSHTSNAAANSTGNSSGGSVNGVPPTAATINATNTDHEHTFGGTTAGRSATHNHTVLVSTPANTGTTETRPEALSFIFAVKT